MLDLNPIRFGTLALLILAGCNSDPNVSPFELAVARDKWNRSGIENYEIEFHFQGQLNYPAGFTRLEVLQGDVVSAQSLDGLITYPPPFDAWPTVSQLFDLIEANTQHHSGSGTIAVDATFDEDRGYPRRVTITCVQPTPDCGATYQFRNLVPLLTIDRP
ncbi:MAG TPA: DUF6174 domain-containing protein [Gemmatimonadales bacterium]|jgi:hypothetical protein|nr:DUF6174 domain-containing protein [Gemmatimonadales bacterium]